MNLSKFFRKTERLITDNSPLILTAIGSAGVLTTAYLTHKAALLSERIISEAVSHPDSPYVNRDPSRRELFEICWKLYIPPALSASLSIAAIIGANRVGTRRAAAVAAAYTITERAFDEYKAKVVEKIGEKSETEVRDSIAQDRITASNKENLDLDIILAGDGEVLCFDSFSGRFFKSDMESLRRAENNVNQQILHEDSATVSNYYSNVGLESTTISDQMGWNTNKMLVLHFSGTLKEYKGREIPCMVVDFGTVPLTEPWRFV